MIDERIFEKLMSEANADYGITAGDGKFIIAAIQILLKDLSYVFNTLAGITTIDKKVYKKIIKETNTDYGIKEEDGKFFVTDVQSVLENLFWIIEELRYEKREIELDRDENYIPRPTEDQEDGETNDKYNNNDNSMHDNIDACNNRER